MIITPAVETVVTHVEAPGRERQMRLRIRLFAVSHRDPSCRPVAARYLLLRRRDVGDRQHVGEVAHIITVCFEFQSEKVAWTVLMRWWWIVEGLCL